MVIPFLTAGSRGAFVVNHGSAAGKQLFFAGYHGIFRIWLMFNHMNLRENSSVY